MTVNYVQIGATGSELTINDAGIYVLPAQKIKIAREYKTIYQPMTAGGVRLTYKKLVKISYDFELLIHGTSYQNAVTNYWALVASESDPGPGNFTDGIFGRALRYWETYKANPNPNPPIYFSEAFFDQDPPYSYLVTDGEHDEPSRDILQAAYIHTHISVRMIPIPA